MADEMIPQASATPYGQNVPKAAPTGDEVRLVSHVTEMFPDACPNFVRNLCWGKTMTEENVNWAVQMMFSIPAYPKRQTREPSPELDFDSQVAHLKEILPDADPTYLESRHHYSNAGLKQFIADAVKFRSYPTKKEYLRKEQLNAQVKQYTTEFDVEKFLEVIPDPETHFREAESKLIQNPDLCIDILKNQYLNLPVHRIKSVFWGRRNLLAAQNELDLMTQDPEYCMRRRRKQVPVDLNNLPILQEIAYIRNRQLILKIVEAKKLNYQDDLKNQ